MWYLAVANTSTTALTDIRLDYELKGRKKVRFLIDVPPGGALDTLWLPASLRQKLAVQLVRNGQTTLWSGILPIAPPRCETVTIPRSPILQTSDFAPLSVRGTNYYPPRAPWSGLWQQTTAQEWQTQFAQMAALNVNAVRTFYLGLEAPTLQAPDASYLPPMIAKISAFLAVAAQHHIKVMLCLDGGGGPEMSDLPAWKRRFRSGVEPFIDDGRVLMWDLINEPGGSKGPKSSPALIRWLQTLSPFLQSLDCNHLDTVGLTWQFDQLWDLGIRPDVGQYHNYSGAIGLPVTGDATVRNVKTDLESVIANYTQKRPLLIGEFGFPSATGSEKTAAEREAALEKQLSITRWVLQGAEAARIAGVMNWCAFEFAPEWMGASEKSFGVIRLDGSLKPAGIVLRDTYARWKTQSPASWDAR